MNENHQPYELKKAAELKDVLDVLDPRRALNSEQELREFFVQRSDSPLAQLEVNLRHSTEPQKILFTGHRGSGKSSELAQLSQDLCEDYYVIKYSIETNYNLNLLDYRDLLLSVALEIIDRSTSDHKLQLKDDIYEEVNNFAKEITKETQFEVGSSAGLKTELGNRAIKLRGSFGLEEKTRTTVREQIQKRLSELINIIDLITDNILNIIGKQILIIVEDLDKTDLAISNEIFFNHAIDLVKPNVSIIYTFPISMRYHGNYQQIANYFHKSFDLPNVKIVTKQGDPDPTGLDQFKQILLRRVSSNLINPEALLKLLDYCSGIPRELIYLARSACLEALAKKRDIISVDDVELAIRAKMRDFSPSISRKQMGLLKGINETKSIDNTEDYQQLLHMLCVIRFYNGEEWYDVHPVVKRLLKTD